MGPMSHTYPEGAPVGFEHQDVDHWTCMREHCSNEVLNKGDRLCLKCREEEAEIV